MANHNAYAPQDVVLEIDQDERTPRVLSKFDRMKGDWARRGVVSTLKVSVAPADGVVLRFAEAKPERGEVERP